MDIKETVTLVNTTGRSDLYNILMNACRGTYMEIANGDDKDKIKNLEKVFADAFDQFATCAFDKGREYEIKKFK